MSYSKTPTHDASYSRRHADLIDLSMKIFIYQSFTIIRNMLFTNFRCICKQKTHVGLQPSPFNSPQCYIYAWSWYMYMYMHVDIFPLLCECMRSSKSNLSSRVRHLVVSFQILTVQSSSLVQIASTCTK